MDAGGYRRGAGAPAEVTGMSPATATTEEEEALKRNTDCFYFLASPLTCKKGSECEFRHSEGARMNPRNCWYWLNANCLNPKCSFRHLPLDGMYGPQGRTSGSSQPAIKTISAMQVPGTQVSAYNLNKQSTPCYYFLKGSCLKGDRCPFMHGPSATSTSHSASISAPQQAAIVLNEQPPSQKRDSWISKESFAQHFKSGVEISTESPHSAEKPTIHADISINNSVHQRKNALPFETNVEMPKTQLSQVLPMSIDGPIALQNNQSHLDEQPQTGMESDEFLPESSPGFDVLVDDNNEDTDYFHSDDEYDGRNLNPVNDFDYHHPDYESLSQFESDRYNMTSEFEHDGPVCNHPDWKEYRRSSERAGQYSHDRQSPEREAAASHIGVSDLRHLLVKQRRLNGSREITASEHLGESHRRNGSYAEDRYGRGSVRERQQYPERSISSRLHGRITLANRSPPDTFVDVQWDRIRHRGRLSPAWPTSNYQGKNQERIRRRLNGEEATDIRGYVRQEIRIDELESSLDFAGPKSLEELRAEKDAECSWNQAAKNGRKMKLESVISLREPEVHRSFESPKPLSVILKRKRETTSGNSAPSHSGDKEHNKDVRGADPIPGVNSYVHPTGASEGVRVGYAEEEEEHPTCPGVEELHGYAHSASEDVLKVEHVIIVDNTKGNVVNIVELKDQELDYDHVDLNLTAEDEAMHQEDDDFDDDDFAEKVGLILS